MPLLAAMFVALAVSIPAAPPPRYSPPVEAPVSRAFDPGPGPYSAGNRGLDYAVAAGDTIRTIGAGTVVFAGPVAGATWVTVLHADGLRSSYGPMATVVVERGQLIAAGAPLGTAGSTFHLGVRRGDTYVDPSPLFARGGPARLVPRRPRGGDSRIPMRSG